MVTAQEAFNAGLLRAVEEDNILGFENICFKVCALIDFTRESINQIVLISNKAKSKTQKNEPKQLLFLNFVRPLLTCEGFSIKALIKSCTVSSRGAFLP